MSKVNWKRKRNYNGKNKNYSISKKLRKDRKSNEEFEIMLGSLTLEELIALKLELGNQIHIQSDVWFSYMAFFT